MVVRKLSQRRGWAITFAASVIKPTLALTTRKRWSDGTKIPATGGCVVALNHISYADPLLSARFVYDHGRIPRYLAKAGMFRNRFLKVVLTSAGQIPVERLTQHAIGAYDAAVGAIRAGECVVVYPEGTITRDPELWPMVGKSGAARIALETGCPVIPVGQWGAQNVLAPYASRPHVFPRRVVEFRAGDPVDLSDLLDRPVTPEVVGEATERIMSAITSLVGELRGVEPPVVRFDPRKAGVKEIGNPSKNGHERPNDHEHDHEKDEA